jgi:ABC-type multidrug transport system ATPase subunit
VRLILSEQIPECGSVFIMGVNPLKDRAALKHIGFVPQFPTAVNLALKS